MEQVLEIYEKPYDPERPVVCMDEQPVQLIKETRVPVAATADHPRRVDYEYERAGTASIFMFCEALSSWRRATARKRRTKVDWAEEVASLLEGRYADCEKITLVCDNLNTHTPGAFYEAFEPARARELVKPTKRRRIAENELLRVPATARANLDDDVHARDDRRHPVTSMMPSKSASSSMFGAGVFYVGDDANTINRRPRIGAESRNFSRKARLGLVTVVALGCRRAGGANRGVSAGDFAR